MRYKKKNFYGAEYKVQFQKEKIDGLQEELTPLLQSHWEQIALNKDKIKLNPAWDEYIQLNELGLIHFYTVRDQGELVGYFCLTVSKSLHYKDHIFAACDIIYVKQDNRAGMTGHKLIKFAEDDLKKLGVSLIAINTKIHAPFDNLLNRMNYVQTERLYTKYIGD